MAGAMSHSTRIFARIAGDGIAAGGTAAAGIVTTGMGMEKARGTATTRTADQAVLPKGLSADGGGPFFLPSHPCDGFMTHRNPPLILGLGGRTLIRMMNRIP